MFRKRMSSVLLVFLVLAVMVASTSCGKLSINRLKANYHFTKANHHFTDNLYRLAIEEYEMVLQFNPGLVQTYRYLGESYKALYKPGVETEVNLEMAEKALEILNKAYEIDSTSVEIIHSLGDMYDKLRRFEEAEALFLKIIEMQPTKMSNYYVVAEFYKRYSGGRAEKKEGEEGSGEGGEAVAIGKAPFQKAEEMFFRRLESDPESPQGYAYLAQFYEDITPIPEFDKGNAFTERRIQLDPENMEAWLSKGVNRWAKAYRLPNLPRQERRELAEDSRVALEKASELDPQAPEPYSWLSVLYDSVMAKLEPSRAKSLEEDAIRFQERFQELKLRKLERKKLEAEMGKIG
ncbi:tetratricopeptide repeat protein [Acidobacteriota bacterium]